MTGRPAHYRTRDLLSPRQQQVISLVARGKTNAEIANELGIGFETVKTHVSEVIARYGVDTREEAVAAWRRNTGGHGQTRRMVESLGWLLGTRGLAMAGVALAGVVTAGVAIAVVMNGGESPEPADPVLEPTPVATSTPATGPYPVGTRIGDPVIDAILAAVEAEDADRLFELIHYVGVPCWGSGTAAPPGAFRCPNGEPDKSLIPSVLGDGVENSAVPEGTAEVRGLVEAFLAESTFKLPLDPRVYAIVSASPALDPGETRIIFASGHTLSVDAKGITGFHTVNALEGEELTAGNATAFLLPPRPPDPQPPGGRASSVRNALLAATRDITPTSDPATGYGYFDTLRATASPRILVEGDVVSDSSSVSVYAGLLHPDQPWNRVENPNLVLFAVADVTGECAIGRLNVSVLGGFSDTSARRMEAGRACSAQAILEWSQGK